MIRTYDPDNSIRVEGRLMLARISTGGTLFIFTGVLLWWALGGNAQNSTTMTNCRGWVSGLGDGKCDFQNNNEASRKDHD